MMIEFAPRVYDKKTGETFQVWSISYSYGGTIYLLTEVGSDDFAEVKYGTSKLLIGTNGWRDIADVVLLLPTMTYDENGEMIYVKGVKE